MINKVILTNINNMESLCPSNAHIKQLLLLLSETLNKNHGPFLDVLNALCIPLLKCSSSQCYFISHGEHVLTFNNNLQAREPCSLKYGRPNL